jgi:hypothetical protein
MAARKSRSNWFLRDIRRSYVLIAGAALVVGVLAVSVDWSQTPREPAAKVPLFDEKAALELRYRGSITIPTNAVDVCRTLTLDNRSGEVRDGGLGKCKPDQPVQVQQSSPEGARLRAVGSAFRHGD